jgi:hypothetical protein
MAGLIIMLGTADADLIAFSSNLQKSTGYMKDTISKLPSGRCESHILALNSTDSLFIIAHGNGAEWGSASSAGLSVSSAEMVTYLKTNLKDGIKVYLCICDSWDSGMELCRDKNLSVWAAKNTPELVWNSQTMQIDDKTGNFAKCIHLK